MNGNFFWDFKPKIIIRIINSPKEIIIKGIELKFIANIIIIELTISPIPHNPKIILNTENKKND